jgi:hypothetical protein
MSKKQDPAVVFSPQKTGNIHPEQMKSITEKSRISLFS